MPLLPSYPPVRARSNNSASTQPPSTHELSKTNATIIAVVVASLSGIIVIGMLIKYLGLPWWRNYKEQKAANEKAIADQKAWYRSTHPIMRRPETPRIVNIYSRSPHIQGHQDEDYPVDLYDSNRSNESDYSSASRRTEVSNFSDASTVTLEPLFTFNPLYPSNMEVGSDLGLQLLDKHHTASTMSTVVSMGVAVPVSLPTSMSPTEVYTSSRPQEEQGSGEVFVVGNHEDV
jgi:hypothetical protein